MFLDWKNQYCENDCTTQSNLQIQCNPYQITNGIFYRTRTKNLLSLLYLFIYLFLAVLGLRFVRGPSPATASGGHSSSRCGDRSSSRCAGLSLSRPLPLRGTGSRRAGSAAVAHGPSRSAACGILPDQGPNPRPLHSQADSQPLHHQGSPKNLKICMETQKTPNSQSSLEGKKRSWRNQTP